MRSNFGSIGMFLLLMFFAGAVLADDDAELNDIYRQFFRSPVSVEDIGKLYRDNIIHVGRSDAVLVRGKPSFLETNIAPLAAMVNSGQIDVSGIAYIVRRIIVGDMANDVGYLYVSIRQGNGEAVEQLQKFSWVFLRRNGRWQVVTDFDGTPAPLTLLDNLQTEFTVE